MEASWKQNSQVMSARRTLSFFFAVIISIWAAAVQSPCCQTQDADAVLRRRISGYWEAMQRNDYETASNYVHPDSRKVFIFRIPKAPILRWKIEKLTFNSDKTTCDALSLVARPIPITTVKDAPDFPVENQWVLLQDGEWYLTLPWKEGENPLLQLFKAAAESKGPVVTAGEPKEPKPTLADSQSRFMADPDNPQIVHRGEKVLFRFHYRNSNTIPIKIFSAHGDCHCTSVQQEHPTVVPGESGTLEVTVDSFGLPFGRVEKQVVVTFSDTDKPEEVTVRFTNAPNFMITPPSVDFGTIRKGTPVEMKVRIVNQSGRPVKFLATYKSEARLTLSLEKSEIGPGESLVLTVRCDPFETGEFIDNPLLRTDLQAEQIVSLTIRGRITP